MRSGGSLIRALGLLFGVVALFHSETPGFHVAEARGPSHSAGETPRPVLVELFTSEGCSSCPPADDLLARLEQLQPVPGAEIIPLSEHVDYWNRLGWADPYSSAQFSDRQRNYAQALGLDTIYTPQMIVDGQIEFVGSHERKAREAVASAARASKVDVHIARLKTLDRGKSNSVPLRIRAGRVPIVSPDALAEVLLAITESGLQSSVSRGENAGRRLSHTAVIRQLKIIGRIQESSSFTSEHLVRVADRWKQNQLRAVVFIQERASRRVLGAASIRLAD